MPSPRPRAHRPPSISRGPEISISSFSISCFRTSPARRYCGGCVRSIATFRCSSSPRAGEIEAKAENFEAGADDYLTKPFAFAELMMRVKALLRRAPDAQGNSLKIADLELDRRAHVVRRAGRRIDPQPQGIQPIGILRPESRQTVVAIR